MLRTLKPVRRLGGTISMPGDKSIAHRVALMSIISHGPLRVKNFPGNLDCLTSLKAAQAFGVQVSKDGEEMVLTPPEELTFEPEMTVDCGNSGTTARLLAGIISGKDCEVTLAGDESLSRRPMKRIIAPLSEMGAEVFADEAHLPMRIRGRKLITFAYRMPVASAQVIAATDLAYYSGDDAMTLPLLAVGGVGLVGTSTHFTGQASKAMIGAYAAGDVAGAVARYQALLPVYLGVFATQGCMLVKAGLAARGFAPGPVRKPLLDASAEQTAAFVAILDAAGL